MELLNFFKIKNLMCSLITLILFTILVQRSLRAQDCYSLSEYSSISNIIKKEVFSTQKKLAIEMLNIEAFKVDALVADDVQNFFEIKDSAYSRLDFSSDIKWCLDVFEGVNVLVDYKNQIPMFMLSKIIFNNEKDKGFLIGSLDSYGGGFYFILFMQKKKKWDFLKFEVLSMY